MARAFTYKDHQYLPIIPAKSLFKSSLIYEVHTRGDIFAMNIKTHVFTVIPGDAAVEYFEVAILRPFDSQNTSSTPL